MSYSHNLSDNLKKLINNRMIELLYLTSLDNPDLTFQKIYDKVNISLIIDEVQEIIDTLDRYEFSNEIVFNRHQWHVNYRYKRNPADCDMFKRF